MQDTIYEFIYHDKDGRHVTTAVGTREYNDMVMYLNTLAYKDMVWDFTYSVIGEDI